MGDLARLEHRLAGFSHKRRLYAGLEVDGHRPAAAGTGGFDFGVVRIREVSSDLGVPTSVWKVHTVGLVSGSTDEALERELSFARHLQLAAVICPLELGERNELCRLLRSHLLDPTAPPILISTGWTELEWRRWHRVRKLVGWDPRLTLCLEASVAPADLDHFLSEPVECIRFDGAFDRDAVRRLYRNRTERVVLARGTAERRAELERLFDDAWRDTTDRERVTADRDEDLVPPVEPLSVDMRSGTYAHFEEATAKYDLYAQALLAVAPRERVVIAGAGRGPLVSAALRAMPAAHVTAVEKNANAVRTLEDRNRRDWGGRVEIVRGDMRAVTVEPADLIVSELLGSFGDNELAPECLEGAERFLREGGVMMPRATTSFLAPLFAPRLARVEAPAGVTLARARLLAEPKACLQFEHPARNQDHRRRVTLSFIASIDAVLNGFAGFFEAELLDGVPLLSTRPATATEGLEGWAPLFFPIHDPVDIKAGDEIRCTMVRDTDGKRVWYEWIVDAPRVLPIHNAGGCVASMSLF